MRKSFKVAIISMLLIVVLVCFASCGNSPKGVSDSFMAAVKRCDFTKASTYCIDNSNVEKWKSDDDTINYIYRKCMSSLTYNGKVKGEVKEEDDSATIEVACNNKDVAKAYTKYGVWLLLHTDADSSAKKKQFDSEYDAVSKKDYTVTMLVKKDSDGNWKVSTGNSAITMILWG